VRAPHVHFPGDPAAGARAALGGSGYLSVIRDLGGGSFYRGQVELRALSVAPDLERYFTESEQVATAVDVAVLPGEGEPLGDVAGLLVQRLPDGDQAALEAVRARLGEGGFRAALARGAGGQDAIAAVAGDGFELLADLELAYRCGCSQARARAAVSALGKQGILDVLENEKEATVTCEFCRQRYVVSEIDLREMVRALSTETE
jgi:molecular chaperone Hsp33